MKSFSHHPSLGQFAKILLTALLLANFAQRSDAASAVTVFQDDFTGGIPGWTAVQPAGGAYIEGPMIWQYDKVSDSFSEQSNIYTDSSSFSVSRLAVMLINNTVAPANFTYTARLTAGDDDAFGLIWGYENETTFYRVTFASQTSRASTGWPFYGWIVDRLNNGQITDLFGPSQSFVLTRAQTFDVTISVSGGLLNLTVVDDPLGAAITNNLVTDGALPTTPSAKVGMFSWGMGAPVAPGNVRGFRIQNPVLSPTALTGDPANTVLTNWSFLVTPRLDGTVPVAPGPLWSQGLSINGDRGTMIENSDWTVDNNAASYTNVPAPSAVAGDENWSNYVYSARFITADDDGFGMLLRFKNPTNFYRIAFRNQSSAAGGIRLGTSIQKRVDSFADQLFASTTAFVPPLNTPIDVHASINTNRLQLIIVANPNGASPTRTLIGPIDITGPTVDNGKIGVFSWAQWAGVTGNATPDSGTEVDSVKVRTIQGEGLLVESAYGTPDPPVGLNDFPTSGSVTASVDSVVADLPGVRRTSTGWSGLGSVPASGTTNSVIFNLSQFSSLVWTWRTEYLLTTNAGAGGTVTATRGPWVPEGSNVTVTATPNPGYMFSGWSGSSISTVTNLTFPMIRPVTLTANFTADSDADGLADSWEMQYFGNLAQTAAGDPDGDGISNLNEFLLGSNPTVPQNLASSDGLSSQWTNTSRDPNLPGELTVVDFGSGYRGAFGNNNEFRYANDAGFIPANNLTDFTSFQSERMIVRSNLWTASWASNFSASIEFSVGDNDGNCFYFRYVNESNWFRVTLCGEDPVGAVSRPPLGVSVQRRVNGLHTNVTTNYISGPLFAAYTDPLDGTGTPGPSYAAGFKRVRLTVNATNQNFEVRVIGWNAALPTPDFDPNNELVVSFTDTNLPSGRIGFGLWGQGGFGSSQNQVNGIPIPNGGFIDNIALKSPANGAVVFGEDFETAALATNLPAGWSNVYALGSGLEGTWVVNVDGSISQLSNEGNPGTGSIASPRADAEAPILLAPDQGSANYLIQAGFHAFDNDAVGLVYDFQDTNNFSRIMLRQEQTYAGDIPPGLSVSRKSGGTWTDIVAGDPSFLYTPGRPFELQFANNNGEYALLARDLDNPTNTARWHWTGPAAASTNRFGISTWSSQNAHLLYARAYTLPTVDLTPFKITNIAISSGNVVLTISKPASSSYNVLRATDVNGPYSPVANNQSSTTYSEPLPVGQANFYRLQLVP